MILNLVVEARIEDTSSLGNEDCKMRSTMVILSKRMLFLDGDHLGIEDCKMRSTMVIFSLKSKRCYELTIYIFVYLAEDVNHRVCCAFGNVSFTIDANNVHIKFKRSTFCHRSGKKSKSISK